jgi:Type I restriction-modification system methyltransferase subunit
LLETNAKYLSNVERNMSEMELQPEVLRKLREHYGEGKVVSEPSLKGKTTVYPDIVVFHTEEQITPFLLVECSRFRTAHRRANDFEEISGAVSSTQAEYGALVSQNAEFVFSGNGPPYKSYADFPEMYTGSPADRRPIQSQAELEFLVERAHNAQNSIRDMPGREEQAIDEFLEYLHLLLEARRQEVPIGGDPDQGVLSKIQRGISERHQCYQQKENLDLSQLSALSLIFNGFDLSETDDDILEYLFDITSEDKRSGGYSTPLELARQMVHQANLEPGDTVLDPAAGRGTILSLSSAEETNRIGVEINLSVVRLATFYLDLFNREVELFAGDFFEIANDSGWSSKPIDHIVVDPPFNADIDRNDIPFS